MAQTIKLKRSGTSGAIPTTSQLELGEVAINTYDGKMYIKKNVGGTESIVEVTVAAADAIVVEYQFTATANQTTFSGSDDNSETLSYSAGAVQIFLNGILLDSGVDYTATNGTSIVLSEVVDANDYLQVFAFKKKISNGQTTVDNFTGNGSTTAFTLSLDPGDENNTRVYIDGVYQSKSNYSVSGTTLTFSTAPPADTAVEVEIGNRVVTLDTLSDLDLPDSVKLRLGTSQDLQIYHDGSTSYINETGTGGLDIRSNEAKISSHEGETMAVFSANAGASLRYNNSAKFATTSAGVSITGKVEVSDTSSGVLVGTNKARLKVSGDDTVLDAIPTGGGLLFRTGGSVQRMTISSTGKVGIATTTNHAGNALGYGLTIKSADFSGSGLEIHRTANSRFEIYQNSTGGQYLDALGSTPFIVFATGGTERMRLSNAGFGIGTSNPQTSLSFGESSTGITFLSTATNFNSGKVAGIRGEVGGTGYGNLAFDTFQGGNGGGERMMIRYDGNVGIGEDDPDEKLVVKGDGARIYVDSADYHVAMIGRRGSSGASLDQGYIRLKDQGTNKVVLDTAGDSYFTGGRLGIGTSSPRYDLAVSGNNATAMGIALDNASGSGTADLAILGSGYNSHQAGAGEVWLYSPDNINIGGATGNTNNIKFLADNKVNMFIQGSNSRVGIGTTAPGRTLDIIGDFGVKKGSSAVAINEYNNGAQIWIDGSDGDFVGGDYFNIGAFGTTDLSFGYAAGVSMTLKNTGRLGIGTTNPDESLHVEKTSGTTLVKTEVASNSTVGFEIAKTGSTTQSWRIVDGQTVNGRLEFYDVTDSATRMAIDGSGNVGIGTASPASLLNISHATAPELRFSRTGTGQQWIQSIDSSGRLLFLEAASTSGTMYTRMAIDDTGQVGIGTGAPAQTLHVSSTGATSNGIRISNSEGSFETRVDDGEFYLYDVNNSTIPFLIGSDGRTGIGTTNPLGQLQISGATAPTTHGGIVFVRNTGATASNTTFGGIHFSSSPGTDYSIGKYNVNTTTYLQFRNGNNGTAYMNLDAGGRLGINQVPGANNFALQVQGIQTNGSDARAVRIKGFGSQTSIGSTGPTLVLQNANSTTNNYTKLSFETANGGETVSINSHNIDHTNHYGDMAFNTRGSSGYSEKMRITSNGTVGIGDTNPPSSVKVAIQHDGLGIRLDGTANTERGIMLRNVGTAYGYFKTDGHMRLIVEDASREMAFYVGNTERLRITSSGNTEAVNGHAINFYRQGNSAYGSLFMDTGENLYIRNSWGTKDIVFARTGNTTFPGAITNNGNITNNSSGHAYLTLNNAGSHESGVILKKSGTNKWEGPYISSSSDNLKFYSYGDSSLQMTLRDGINANGGLELRGLGVSDGTAHYGHYGALFLDSTTNYTSSARSWMITNAYTANQFAILYGSSAGQFPVLGTGGGAGTNSSVAFSIQNNGVARFHGDLTVDGDVQMANGRGISFTSSPNTSAMSSELLDDYEEGTWTPALSNGGSMTVQGATYTKVGREVSVRAYVTDITPTNNSSMFIIGGLPFTTHNTSGYYGAGNISYNGNGGDLSGVGILNVVGGAYLYFHYIDGSTGAALTNANWISQHGSGTGKHLIFSITYITV